MDSEISENGGEAYDDSTDAEYVPDEEEAPEETHQPERKKIRDSIIWKYFKKIPPASEGRARCLVCCEIKSYKTSSTNLKQHLKQKHPRAMKQLNELRYMNAAARPQKSRHSDSTVWKYFEKVLPESEKMAKCNFCHRILSYRSTVTNLKSHLTSKHDKKVQHDRQMVRTIESGSNLSEILEDDDRNDGNDPNDDSQQVKHGRPDNTDRRKCFVWKYFTKMKPLHARMARCNYCHKMRSYRSTVTNLKRHMMRKHPEIVNEDDHFTGKQHLLQVKHGRPDSTDRRKCFVWKYFTKMKPLHARMARCNHCHKMRSYRSTVTNLKRHMMRKHPEIVKEDDHFTGKQHLLQVKYRRLDGTSRKKCFVWKYFTKMKPLHARMAQCNYCHKMRSYRSTVTNLKIHMTIKHPEIVKDDAHFTGKQYLLDDSDSEKLKQPNRKSQKVLKEAATTKLFQIDRNRNVARCRLCSQDIHFTTNATLKYHFLKMHDEDESPQGSSTVNEEEINQDDTSERVKGTKFKNDSKQSTGRQRLNLSKYWDHFELVDKVNKTARCNICGKKLSYSSTTCNLKKHLLSMHFDDLAYSPENSQLKRDSKQSTGKHRINRSENWDHFDLVDKVKKTAKCKFCDKVLSYSGTIGNLKSHLLKMHSVELACSPKNTQLKRKHIPRNNNHRYRSNLWKYFEVADEEAKLATCKLCDNNFNYKCTSNLKKHLKRMHEVEFSSSDEVEEEEYEDGEAEVLEEQRSAVWAYFKCLSQDLKIASCLICKKRVDYNDYDDLSKHLNRKHPQAQAELETTKPKKLMITGNGDIYEIDEDAVKQESDTVEEAGDDDSGDWPYQDNETDALETSEYLDETIFNEPKLPTKKRRKSYNKTPNKQDEAPRLHTKNNTSPPQSEDSTLDIFGKYMVSLLKTLPKHKSNQLQANFVKQIMEAQSDSQNTRSVSSIANTRIQNIRTSVDDTRVTSNSGVQRVITDDGEIQLVLGKEPNKVTSAEDDTMTD